MSKHDCSDVLSKVFLSLDGELSEEEEKAFLAELEKCSCCLESYNIEKSFKEFLKSKIEKRPVHQNLANGIKAKIKELSVE